MLADGKVMPGNSDVLQVSYGDDNGLFVEFYTREVESVAKSQAEGRPIYVSKEFIRIIPVGDKTKVVDRPVRKEPSGQVPADTARFARQWQAYENQQTDVIEGTPITEWPPITRADAMSMKALNIHTVEMLASLGENNLTWLGARQMRDKAAAWIEKAKENSSAVQWAKEKEGLQTQIEALQNQMQGLKDAGAIPQEATASPDKPKKRGRPAKVKHERDIPSTDEASG